MAIFAVVNPAGGKQHNPCVTAIDMIGQLSFHSMELLSLVAGDRANMNLVHFPVSTSLRVFLNNVTWRLFLSKFPEFSKTNSCSYQKRETPELEGALDDETARWVASVSDQLAERLAACGLIPARQGGAVTLGQWLDTYFAKRTDLKPQTLVFYGHTRRNLLECFGPDRPLASLTAGDGQDFVRFLKSQGLAEATIARRVQAAKTIFNAAADYELLPKNPFRKLSGSVQGNRQKMRFIDRQTIQKVIEACPDAEWRLLVALARYGGLRIPSEALMLKWEHIDWHAGTMLVHSPEMEHHPGCAMRLVPIFPELRPYLEEAWELAPEGAEYVITRYRHLAKQVDQKGFHNANLRTQFLRIIKRAGLQPWPKPWQNLRSSRQTELLEHYPIHVV
ncbi:MAG: site-specific integrase, partial [Chloroflexi bacterium]|nr:site-specific integrase [Chloroflexota bacterium]